MIIVTVAELIKEKKIQTHSLVQLIDEEKRRWYKNKSSKYFEQITDIVKEYASKVDIAQNFRQQWNMVHPPWEQFTSTKGNMDRFASHVKYRLDEGVLEIYNDAKPQNPMWGSHIPKEGELSDWIEGDKVANSYIHPIPPYWEVNGRKIFKDWIEYSEWKNMWYEADPYIRKALQDPRIKKIIMESRLDFAKQVSEAIVKKWGG